VTPGRPLTAMLTAVLVLGGCADNAPSGQDSGQHSRPGATGSPAPGGAADSTTPGTDPRGTDPGPRLPENRPSRAEQRLAGRLVGDLSLAELAGQVIVARYQGTAAPTALVRDLHLGGVIVFDDNIASTGQIRASNAALRSSVGRPLLVGVDQEGGTVERVQGAATRFPGFMSTGAADDVDLTREAARASGAELLGLGFDVVFAPDADVTSGRGDPTIGARSAGSEPRLVARHVAAALAGYREAGIVAVPKHFPGHGSVPADSHEVLPVQRRALSVLESVDLVPFRQAIAVGAPAIMVGHLDVRAVDPGVPASLSRKVVHGLLRQELGFDGLVVTDALDMDGVERRYDSGTSAVAALRAGADVLLMPPSPARARSAIVAAVHSGRLDRDRLEEAATRLLATLLHQRAHERRAPGTSGTASAALSRAAITVVRGPCSGRLVGRAVHVVSENPDALEHFRAAARTAGLRLSVRGDRVVLIERDGAPVRRGAVAVATDTPYVLARSRPPVRIATYGDSPGAMAALVDVLLGRATAPGRLPVEVRGAGPGC